MPGPKMRNGFALHGGSCHLCETGSFIAASLGIRSARSFLSLASSSPA